MAYRYLLAVLTIAPLTGCAAALQDMHYEHTQKKRTWIAWAEYAKCTPQCIDDTDYRNGWRAGYYDVLIGNSGCPPLVPPKKYWRPCQVTWHCDENRHEWYIGFQDGANCAKQQPDTHNIRLWMPPPAHCPTNCPCPAESVAPVGDFIPPMAPAIESTPTIDAVDTPMPPAILTLPDEDLPEFPPSGDGVPDTGSPEKKADGDAYNPAPIGSPDVEDGSSQAPANYDELFYLPKQTDVGPRRSAPITIQTVSGEPSVKLNGPFSGTRKVTLTTQAQPQVDSTVAQRN